jgi:hypothetical protein
VAYDPTVDTWRELPPPPLSETGGGPAGVWIDQRFFVIAREEMVAYRPITDTWEVLAPPPTELNVSPPASVVAVDDQLVVWPQTSGRSTSTGLVYDLASDSWSELPEPPTEAWPAVADVAWTGTELIIVGGLPAPWAGDSQRLVGARLDWATRQWTALPDVWPEPLPSEGNLGSQSILWTGEVLLVLAGPLGSGADPLDGVVATYNPDTNQWRHLESLDNSVSWHPPLVQAGDDVITITGAQLQRIAVSADAGEPVGPEGLPVAATPPVTDIPLRGVSVTLVGTNGNGAAILVLDLDLGLQTIYEPERHHQLGSGGLTDLAMDRDRSLYVWRTDEPTIRFQGGTGPFDGDRLTFGELSQPGQIVEAGGQERFVLPVPSSSSMWVLETSVNGAVARLVAPDTETSFEVELDGAYAPRGVSDGGSLVLTTETTIAYLKPDGRRFDLGTGTVVAIAGDEILIQECGAGECSRRWGDLETGRTTRVLDTDRLAWAAPTGPIIPGHAAPLTTTSPDHSQILVTATPPGHADNPDSVELLRVDVATMATEPVPLPHGVQPGLATWARDGNSIIVLWRNDITVAHLPTGRVDHHPNLIPDGYFILATG